MADASSTADWVEGVVVVVRDAGRFLMIRRSASVVVPHAWCFVGGAIEAGETQEQAVVREFREEVGGVVRPLRQVWQQDRPEDRLRLYWWLAELECTSLQPNPLEVAELCWCTPTEARALPDLLPGNREFFDGIGATLPADSSR